MEHYNYVKEDKRYRLGFEEFVIHDDEIWFSSIEYNGLFKCNIKDYRKIQFCGFFPEEKKTKIRLYVGAEICGDYIMFSPMGAENIAVYNVKTAEFRSIGLIKPIKKGKILYNPGAKFWATGKYKNYVFLIGATYPAIIRYDTISGGLTYLDNWVRELEKYIENTEDIYFTRGLIEGSKLLLPSCNANVLMQFDMNDCSYNLIPIKKNGCGFSGICYDGKYYWLTPRNNEAVVRYDKDTMEVQEYNNFPDGYKGSNVGFLNPIYYKGFLWLFPHKSNMVIKINSETGYMEEAKILHEDIIREKSDFTVSAGCCMSPKLIGPIIYFCSGKNYDIIKYCVQTEKIERFNLILEEKDRGTVLRGMLPCLNKIDDISGNILCRESKGLGINEYIEYLKYDNKEISKECIKLSENQNSSTGLLIHNQVKSYVS